MREVEDMLRDPYKGIDAAEGDLAIMFRRLLMQRRITVLAMTRYMSQWLNDPANRIPADGKKKSTERSNYFKEIRKPHMTWKVFVKNLRFFRLKNVKFTLEAEWEDGVVTVTEHCININNQSFGTFTDDVDAPVDDTFSWGESNDYRNKASQETSDESTLGQRPEEDRKDNI